MKRTQTLTNYDYNASHYDQYRRPSPIILNKLQAHFSGASKPILSVGCGTARMEYLLLKNFRIIGLDRSTGMLQQAKKRISFLTQGDMVTLPFENNAFSGAYLMQSLHHVGANLSISTEERASTRFHVIRDVLRTIDKGKIIVIQRDPTQNQSVWFWHYFPRALEVKLQIQPKVETIKEWLTNLGLNDISATPIMDPLARNFFKAETPLDPTFRRSISEFSYLTEEETRNGIQLLQNEIDNGKVYKKIQECKRRFDLIGGTIYLISARK